ncbi:MAG: shikimate dehydrogenase, partial [Alistipes sp.]|nr:shikimate dehydrogenase [Alistipes sp.]
MKRYGLIGKTLGHSFSARYFAQKFEREGLSSFCHYGLYELP